MRSAGTGGIAEVFYRKISGETETETVTEADVAEVLGDVHAGDRGMMAATSEWEWSEPGCAWSIRLCAMQALACVMDHLSYLFNAISQIQACSSRSSLYFAPLGYNLTPINTMKDVSEGQ